MTNHKWYTLWQLVVLLLIISTCTLSLCELQVTILSIKLNTTRIFQNISLQSTPFRNCRSSHTSQFTICCFLIFIAGDEGSVLTEKLHACEEGTEELLESVKEVQGKFADYTVRLTIDSN